MTTPIRSALEDILFRYWKARHTDRRTNDHPVCAQLISIAQNLFSSDQVRRFPHVSIKWSIGQGNWATIPWIAALDSRETTRTSSGIYIVYLFCADMSGVYLTLNQGTTEVQAQYGRDTHSELRRRAKLLRKRTGALTSTGFDIQSPPNLRQDAPIVRGYEVATVAHKLYERGAVPGDAQLLADLDAVLDVYDALVPSRRVLGDRPEPADE